MEFMRRFVKKYLNPEEPLFIGDVGSLNINGSYAGFYRRRKRPHWKYFGIDLQEGKNVDIVVPHRYEYSNIENGFFDIVISGQTLEHVEYPFKWMWELNRILKMAGLICIIAPWKWKEHETEGYKDFWRIMPSGIKLLLEESNFLVLDVWQGETDTVGIGRKIADL